jgi:hypothetical protein
MGIYFSRAGANWKKTETIALNSIYNKLKYDGLYFTESELKLIAGFYEVSYLSKNKGYLDFVSKNPVNNLSFTLGIYVEQFYNDDFQELKRLVIKNLKMRISPPMLYFPVDLLSRYNITFDSFLNEVLLLNVGYEEMGDILIFVNPINGEYLNISFSDIQKHIFIERKLGVKWIMMNAPGMVPAVYRNKNDLLLLAFHTYAKRFLYLEKINCELIQYGKAALESFKNDFKSFSQEDWDYFKRRIKVINSNERCFGRDCYLDVISKYKEMISSLDCYKRVCDSYKKFEFYVMSNTYEEIDFLFLADIIEEIILEESCYCKEILKLRRLNDN